MGAGVGEPEEHYRVGQHLADRVCLLVEQRPRQQQRAVGLEREVDERLDRGDRPRVGDRHQRAVGPAVVAGRAVGLVEHEERVEPGPVAPGLVDEAGPARGIAQRGEPRCGGERLQLLPRRVRVERGAVGEPGEQPDEAGRGLGSDPRAPAVRRLGQRHGPPEVLALLAGLGEVERDRAPGTRAHGLHPRELVVDPGLRRSVAVEAGGDLEHAAGADDPGQHEELVGLGPGPGHEATVGYAVAQGARRREAERAGVDRITDERGHRRDLVGGRRRALVEGPVAHHVVADGRVPDHAPDVHTLGDAVEPVEVAGIALPVPRKPVEDALPRDVLDRLHHRGQVAVVLGVHGREGHAAVAHHDRGDAVPARRARDRVPRELGVEVGVDVDEAGGDEATVGVELARAARVDGPHLDDAPTGDRDVRDPRGCPGPVHDGPVADHQVGRHGRSVVSVLARSTGQIGLPVHAANEATQHDETESS